MSPRFNLLRAWMLWSVDYTQIGPSLAGNESGGVIVLLRTRDWHQDGGAWTTPTCVFMRISKDMLSITRSPHKDNTPTLPLWPCHEMPSSVALKAPLVRLPWVSSAMGLYASVVAMVCAADCSEVDVRSGSSMWVNVCEMRKC